jgi:hypothetical protein
MLSRYRPSPSAIAVSAWRASSSRGRGGAQQLLGAGDQRRQPVVVQASEHQDLGAGQQGGVQLEAGVLGGRTDQHDRPVLHVREERVLLGAVEAVDLVDEQQRALPDLTPPLRGEEHLAQVGNPGERRGQRLEHQVGPLGREPRDRRLAAAGRSPQHHRGQPVRGEHPPDRGVVGEQVVLPHDVREGPGAQPVRERARGVVQLEQRRRVLGHGDFFFALSATRS